MKAANNIYNGFLLEFESHVVNGVHSQPVCQLRVATHMLTCYELVLTVLLFM